MIVTTERPTGDQVLDEWTDGEVVSEWERQDGTRFRLVQRGDRFDLLRLFAGDGLSMDCQDVPLGTAIARITKE